MSLPQATRTLRKAGFIFFLEAIIRSLNAIPVEVKSTFSPKDILNWNEKPLVRQSERIAGYRGIWFALGFSFDYGDKYSGGLGTLRGIPQWRSFLENSATGVEPF